MGKIILNKVIYTIIKIGIMGYIGAPDPVLRQKRGSKMFTRDQVIKADT